MEAKYFTKEELACKHCLKLGKSVEEAYHFEDDFLQLMDAMREECDFVWPISSAYRCVDHPIEAKKDQPGAHTRGCAIDVQVSGWKAYRLLEIAMRRGIKRIGVNQSGPHSQRFIHLDTAIDLPMPAIWSY